VPYVYRCLVDLLRRQADLRRPLPRCARHGRGVVSSAGHGMSVYGVVRPPPRGGARRPRHTTFRAPRPGARPTLPAPTGSRGGGTRTQESPPDSTLPPLRQKASAGCRGERCEEPRAF